MSDLFLKSGTNLVKCIIKPENYLEKENSVNCPNFVSRYSNQWTFGQSVFVLFAVYLGCKDFSWTWHKRLTNGRWALKMLHYTTITFTTYKRCRFKDCKPEKSWCPLTTSLYFHCFFCWTQVQFDIVNVTVLTDVSKVSLDHAGSVSLDHAGSVNTKCLNFDQIIDGGKLSSWGSDLW